MNDLQKYITSYFGVEQQALEQVSTLFHKESIAKGKYYTKADQYCNKMSFVHLGYMRVYKKVDEKEITQWISGKGYFVTDLSGFVFHHRSRWNIQAITDCELYTIDHHRYAELQRMVPNWLALERKFLASCFMTLEERVFAHLSLTAEERYDWLSQLDHDLFHKVPQNYLASMLGMSPETFSRIRAKKIS